MLYRLADSYTGQWSSRWRRLSLQSNVLLLNTAQLGYPSALECSMSEFPARDQDSLMTYVAQAVNFVIDQQATSLQLAEHALLLCYERMQLKTAVN